jgi:hypothetical protein
MLSPALTDSEQDNSKRQRTFLKPIATSPKTAKPKGTKLA